MNKNLLALTLFGIILVFGFGLTRTNLSEPEPSPLYNATVININKAVVYFPIYQQPEMQLYNYIPIITTTIQFKDSTETSLITTNHQLKIGDIIQVKYYRGEYYLVNEN